MAKQENKGVSAGLMGADDGYLYVRGLEDNSLNEYLALYNCRMEAYRVEKMDYGTKVTLKLAFPTATNSSNVNLWSFFIAQAAHKIGKKPFIEVRAFEGGYVSFVSFIIFANPKYMESKGSNRNDF